MATTIRWALEEFSEGFRFPENGAVFLGIAVAIGIAIEFEPDSDSDTDGDGDGDGDRERDSLGSREQNRPGR